jgi:hypothetical protein
MDPKLMLLILNTSNQTRVTTEVWVAAVMVMVLTNPNRRMKDTPGRDNGVVISVG